MGSDWDEIKRLAADFQKAQLTSTLQKLSERNCIEIVTLLLEKKLIEVIFTNDGKEYITPEQLEREIQDELYCNGGRVNLVEVSKSLNVDLSRIEDAAQRIAAGNGQIYFMLGQLIDDNYITLIAQEINEKLLQKGEISISELTLQFDLPSEFLQRDVVEKHLGKIIRARQHPSNPHYFFTHAYVQRCKAKIRGALAAITRPTNVSAILQQINVPEKVFHSVVDEIGPDGQFTSKMSNAQYLPHIYAKIQVEWANSFYRQNGFLEYDAIAKLGITEVKSFIRKQFPNEQMLFLKHCAISSKIIDLNVLSSLTECSATKSFVDLSTILPSNMSSDDIEELFHNLLTQEKSALSNRRFIYLDNIVFSQEFIDELLQACKDMASANAKRAIEAGIYQQYLAEKLLRNKNSTSRNYDDDDDEDDAKLGNKRDERRKKAASGKAGGGAQGRETKTKSTKKHQGGGRGARADSDVKENIRSASPNKLRALEFVKLIDVVELIRGQLNGDGLDHLAEPIAELYHGQLNQIALSEAQKLFAATPQTSRRQTHSDIQEKINALLVDMRLYEKGLKLFLGDVQTQLVKYLLKTLGNDICNEITAYIASECNLTLKSTNLNTDQRNKIAQECAAEYKNSLLELNRAANKTIEDFVNATEAVLKKCSMIVKKIDRKKDRQLIVQHREKLCQQLQEETDSALVLHLTVLTLFTTLTGCILHASGKFVGHILSFMRPQMSAADNELLLQYHDLVLKVLQNNANPTESTIAAEQLQGLQNRLKQLALTTEQKQNLPKVE